MTSSIEGEDLAVALGVAAFEIPAAFLASNHARDRTALDLLGLALLAIGPFALVWRRRRPAAVLIVTFAATFAYLALRYPGGPIYLALIVAVFNAIVHRRRLIGWGALGLGYLLSAWGHWSLGRWAMPSAEFATGLAAWLLLLGAVAEILRVRRERQLETVRIETERARRRAGEERLAIARELHDVLAHNISLVNVQASAALHLFDERPDQARAALAAIKDASNRSLAELRSALDALRRAGEHPPRAPAASLTRLDELIARTRETGLQVEAEVAGGPHDLPPAVDLAAFRIIQEALTNVVRHADGASTSIRIIYGEGEITVQVDDRGTGNGSEGAAAGQGIAGMRERAVALGGQLQAGPRPGGGFRVLARLPLASSR